MCDGDAIVDIDAGFEVAPGDASDIEVANAHPWGSRFLMFSDGACAATASHFSWTSPKDPSFKGMSCYFLNWIPATKSHMKTGRKLTDYNTLHRDGATVATGFNDDVLLRWRAMEAIVATPMPVFAAAAAKVCANYNNYVDNSIQKSNHINHVNNDK
jgi:hypothetical protein